MLSSISNSNERAPQLPYRCVWLTTIVLGVAMLGGWEGFWRARGFTPKRNDDVGWWEQERSKVETAGNRAVVLVGSSRMQLGLDTQIFAQKTGIKPIQLAIDNDAGVAILRDLAADPNFHGTVICDLMEKYVIWIGQGPESTQADDWLREYHGSNVFSRFEWKARRVIQTSFAFRLPDLSAQNLALNLRLGRLPSSEPYYITIEPDRSKRADYTLTDLNQLRANHELDVQGEFAHMPRLSPAEFLSRAQPLIDWATAIERRGGRVVFVRFPSSGAIRQLEDDRFPRADYWDPLVSGRGLYGINFAEFESLREFTCPDGTHLDYRDAARFTAALTDILLQKKLLPTESNR